MLLSHSAARLLISDWELLLKMAYRSMSHLRAVTTIDVLQICDICAGHRHCDFHTTLPFLFLLVIFFPFAIFWFFVYFYFFFRIEYIRIKWSLRNIERNELVRNAIFIFEQCPFEKESIYKARSKYYLRNRL